MALVEIREDYRAHKATHTKFREYQRSFIVIFDDYHDGGASAIAYVGQQFGAAINEPYSRGGTEFDGNSICRKVEASPYQDQPHIFQVVAEYSNEPDSGGGQDPVARPVEIRWTLNKTTRPLEKDVITGEPVVNSAGEKFEEPPFVDHSRLVLQYTRNEASFNPQLALSFADKVNSATWNGFAPRKVKVSNIGADIQYEGFFVFWKVMYEFEFSNLEKGWVLEVLDVGYRGYTAVDGEGNGIGNKVEFQDERGISFSKPSFLSNGALSDSPSFIDFNGYDETSFGPLNITLP